MTRKQIDSSEDSNICNTVPTSAYSTVETMHWEEDRYREATFLLHLSFYFEQPREKQTSDIKTERLRASSLDDLQPENFLKQKYI